MDRGGALGLEGSCCEGASGWLRESGGRDGVELLQAWFGGVAFARHRHDTYAVGVTDSGVQQFDYRGATRTSLPGQVVVLHPDEPHDGRAGSSQGFGYRIAYVQPARIAAAARAIRGRATPLPCVKQGVLASSILARAIDHAFVGFPAEAEPLALDALVLELAHGLIAADPALGGGEPRLACDLPAVERARQFLDAACTRVVASHELERVSGHSRYGLARQFRQVYGTSPYRYLLMRRLERARERIAAGIGLAQVAAELGFADQAHLARHFKATYGLTPARFRSLLRAA